MQSMVATLRKDGKVVKVVSSRFPSALVNSIKEVAEVFKGTPIPFQGKYPEKVWTDLNGSEFRLEVEVG